ncbi:hypothetical protein CQA53_10970, partial [Helicobacter didelphidarum]
MSKEILIQAINLKGNPINGFKDVIKLYLNSSNDVNPIPCDEERENGIYVFNIKDDRDTMSKVFVQLSQDKAIKEKVGSTYETITYQRKPHFLHPTCMQINILECMLHNDKIVPYTFAPYGNTPMIAMIKAYKFPTKESCTNISNDTFDNTLQSYRDDWYNEIYTIDMEQTIRLQAFIGNSTTTKTIKEDVSNIDVSQIKWGYSIVKSGLKTNINNYPKMNHKEKNITPLENKVGTNIVLNLREITQDYKANTDILDDSGNNIILFAYTKDYNEKITHLDYRKTNNKRATTIQCIELKILTTRFYLHYDGEILEFLENERVLYTLQETPNKEIALFLKNSINTTQSQSTSTNNQQSLPQSSSQILEDNAYIISYNNSICEVFHQAIKSSNLSQPLKEGFQIFINEYGEHLSSLNSLKLIVAYNKEIIIEAQRYYEDTNLTASRFRIRVQDEDLLKCPQHKAKGQTKNTHNRDSTHATSSIQYEKNTASHTKDSKQILQDRQSQNTDSKQTTPLNTNKIVFDTKEQDCKDCKALRDLTQWENHYFLERSGYDCITPNLELRIPEGRY